VRRKMRSVERNSATAIASSTVMDGVATV
jgi:hypothetical protein